MNAEMIEKALTSAWHTLEEQEEQTAELSPVSIVLPLMQCQLLLDILKALESIESHLASMEADSWKDHHER